MLVRQEVLVSNCDRFATPVYQNVCAGVSTFVESSPVMRDDVFFLCDALFFSISRRITIVYRVPSDRGRQRE